jgi:hypothetical protein
MPATGARALLGERASWDRLRVALGLVAQLGGGLGRAVKLKQEVKRRAVAEREHAVPVRPDDAAEEAVDRALAVPLRKPAALQLGFVGHLGKELVDLD